MVGGIASGFLLVMVDMNLNVIALRRFKTNERRDFTIGSSPSALRFGRCGGERGIKEGTERTRAAFNRAAKATVKDPGYLKDNETCLVEEMSNCRSCGKPIRWIELKSGKKMPVDPDPFELWEAEDGDTVVTEMGDTIKYNPEQHKGDDREVYVSHFSTCPDADSWRRK